MGYFVVSYDLVNERGGFDYEPLWAALSSLDSVKCLLSVYMVSADVSQQQLCDYLYQYIDEDDRLMVWQFYEKPSYNHAALKGTKAWLREHFG